VRWRVKIECTDGEGQIATAEVLSIERPSLESAAELGLRLEDSKRGNRMLTLLSICHSYAAPAVVASPDRIHSDTGSTLSIPSASPVPSVTPKLPGNSPASS
jgi:hypothetical protein